MTLPPRPGPALRLSGPRVTPSVRSFLANEAGSGAALLAATVIALLWSNLPGWSSYEHFWDTLMVLQAGGHGITMDFRHVVNDGLMTVFFLVIGLEISREVTTGELRDRRTVLVPALGALGGMTFPVVIYLCVNHSGPSAHGWGIVMSSDTAFVLGVLALFGPRCPDQLRLFLLTLAVVDDLGAILVLALFYTAHLNVGAALGAAAFVLVILALRWLGVWRLTPYALAGIGLWFTVYESGLQATLAGVLLGLLVPARPIRHEEVLRVRIYGRALVEEPNAKRARLASLAAAAAIPANERMQRSLHPWSAYFVIPAFGLANAGIHLSGPVLRQAVHSKVTIAIVVALVVGNMLGITSGAALALRLKLGVLPGQVRYSHLLGGAILAGMGFTIALFITDLAFHTEELRNQAKIGILAGSIIAATLGAFVLRVMGERSSLCSPAGDAAPVSLPPLPWASPVG